MEVVASVCNRLIDFAVEEYGLLRNLKEEARSLGSTVSVIKALLHDAGEKQARDEAVRLWLGELKQVLFDAEDIIDEVATDARTSLDGSEPETGGARQTKVRNIICFCFGRVERIPSDLGVAHQIKDVKLKLDGMYDQKNKLGLQTSELRESRPATRPPTCSLLPDVRYIGGRDYEKEKMIELLLRPEEVIEPNVHKDNVQVLVIAGFGGVGKTTLAKLTFDDPRVKDHFQQLMMWVCVSEDFDCKRIAREIMTAVFSSEERKELSEISNWDFHQRRFKDKIEHRRFLLVLDDMWEEDSSKWETLCEPLIHGAEGSKIIVTTRNQKIFKMVNGKPFPLDVMSSEALWPVFRRYAFGNDEPSEKMQLEIVGRQILTKLKGLPLAAKVIGRLLNKSLDMNHWANILKSEIFTLPAYSSDILPVLKLSYDHLSTNLKQCFAYCSLFPKDYIFFEDELISMWMAQNFIQITRDLHAEQVGRESIQGLLHQSFFDVERSSEQYKMHDLIHDLAESISKDDCFRLGDDKQKQMSENVRHVSIATDSLDSSKWMEILNHEKLRTLVFLHENTCRLTPPLDDLFKKLKRLRVLGLRGCKIEELPSSIGKLKHLRFVDLSKTSISNLPDSISDLHNLQVLKLKGCELLSALPRNTGALVNLRHLELDTEIASWVPGLGKLTALQELIVNGSKVGELADMGMLKELRIWGLEGVASAEEAVRARLEAKEHLELLELRWGQSSDNRPRQHSVSEEVVDALRPVNSIRRLSVRSYEGARSPKWMGDPSWVSTSFLVKVELRDCRKWEVLPPLGQLPCLKVLQIRVMPGVRRIGPEFFSCCCCDDGEGGVVKLAPGFPSLEELEFWGMREWEEWESPVVVLLDQQQQQQHPLLFPRLRTLELRGCEKLRELPPLPPTLTTLFLHKVGLTRLPGWMEERCSDDDIGRDGVTMPASSSSPSLLSTLKIVGCPNITSLGDGLLQRPLRMLKELTIDNCRELRSLLGCTVAGLISLEDLTIRNCPKLLHLVEEGGAGAGAGAAAAAASVMSSSSPVLLIPSSTVVVVAKKIISLKILTASSCSPKQIATWLRQVSSLQALSIWNCPQLRCFGAGTDGDAGPGDDDTTINGGDLDVDLEGALLDLAPSLRSLEIRNCGNLSSLPSKLRSLTRLETLEIRYCRKIQRLPCAGLPETLKRLVIRGCPELEGRCREEGCPDWPLLSHIPDVESGW